MFRISSFGKKKAYSTSNTARGLLTRVSAISASAGSFSCWTWLIVFVLNAVASLVRNLTLLLQLVW